MFLHMNCQRFWNKKLLKIYDFDNLRVFVYSWKQRLWAKYGLEFPQDLNDWSERAISVLFELNRVAEKFQFQLNQTFQECKTNADLLPTLTERCSKATVYFIKQLDDKCYIELKTLLNSYTIKPKQKKWRKELDAVSNVLFAKRNQLIYVSYRSIRLFNDEIPLVSEQLAQQQTYEIVEKPKNERKVRAKKNVSQKNESGDFPETVQLTYNIYLKSKSIEETAKERDLVKSTIESHLMKCVELGMLEVMEFVDIVSIEEIRSMKSSPDDKLSDIKLKLNDKYSYFQIKLALLESKI